MSIQSREIKASGIPKSPWTLFDMLGDDEVALSKAFAFILGHEKNVLSLFLKHIGLRKNITQNAFKAVRIRTEYAREEGRTDIEIELPGIFHIIIEAKVRGGRITIQRNQYRSCFKVTTRENILVFITQEQDTNYEIQNNVNVINTSWLDIANILDNNTFNDNRLVNQFMSYISRNFKMNMLKEILIQDLSHPGEIAKFKDCAIYRREQTYGTPLYFAPYFTRNANLQDGEGIPYLSKILGVLTLNPADIGSFEQDLYRFKNDKLTVEKWMEGVRHDINLKDELMTYYFLDEPLQLNKNLLKDKGNEKGRGKGWIAANIPKNRCVSFSEFVKRMNDQS